MKNEELSNGYDKYTVPWYYNIKSNNLLKDNKISAMNFNVKLVV